MTAVKRRERRARTALGLSLLISVPFAARAAEPPPQALTLQQALRRAIEANASTATARSQVTASEAQVRQLRNSILPHFDLDTAVTRNSQEVAFDVNGFRATLLPLWDWSARINLSQPIYAGQREHMALRQGRLTVTSNQAAVRSAEDMVLLATASDYLGILQGQDLVAVEQRNLELAGRRRKQAQAFYEAGEQTKVDVLRADTDSKAAERALAEAQRSRDVASSRLRLDIALDQPAAPLAPIQAQPPNLKVPPLPPAETLIADAEAGRATVQRAQLALEIATLETRKQGAARLPTVRAEGDILRQRTTFPADQTAALTIRLTMPIFDSGEISAKVAVAREQQRQAEIALAEAKRQVREDVLQALLNPEDGRDRPRPRQGAARRRRGRIQPELRALPGAGGDLARSADRRDLPGVGPPGRRQRHREPRPGRGERLVRGWNPEEADPRGGGAMSAFVLRRKEIALAAAVLLAAGCAHKPADKPAAVDSATSTATSATAPAPALPADVAGLATPDKSAAAAPAAAATPGNSPAPAGATTLAALQPTGEFVSPSRSEVAPKEPGRVAAVYVEAGSRVSRGQPLLTLETDYFRIDVQRATADLARAKAAEEEGRRDFERKKGLLGNESIPQATFDRSQSAYSQAQAARASAEAALSLARQHLDDAVMHSPMTGVVSERRTDVGQRLGEAGVAFVIEQTAPLKLRFSIPERYLGELKTGRTVTAHVDPDPGESFTGRIKTVGGVNDPATRTFFAEAEFANADGRLRPGLFARVDLGASR